MARIHPPTCVSWAPLASAALLTLVACTASPASPSAGQSRVPDGSWGGAGIGLEVGDSDVRVEFDCAHATLPPLALDAGQRFDVAAMLIMERGGPVRQGEPERAVPARYTGSLDGDTLTLVVTLDTGGSGETFTATRGAAPRLRKCR